jgi:hypothetical protein
MRIIPFGDVASGVWDDLVEQSSEAWLFHQTGWIAIESRFFADENCSFGVLDDRGEIVAVCPLYQRHLERGRWTERLLDSGHHRQAGPAIRDALPGPVRKAAIKMLMRQILDESRRLDVDRIHLNSHNLAPASSDGRTMEIPFWVQEFGFQLGLYTGQNGDLALPGLSSVSADQIVDLTEAEDTVFQRLDENFRKAVRKGRKAGFAIEEDDKEPIEDYYTLAEVSAQRTQECLPSREYYQSIWSALHRRGQCAVLFARHGDRRVAAIYLLVDKGSAFYLAGVSHHDFLPMRVNNFLHWEALRWARNHGCRRYRLGPVFPELPRDWPVSRVSRFKGEFGAASRTITQGSLFLKPERYLEEAREAVALRCRCLLPDAEPLVAQTPRFKRVLRRLGSLGLGSIGR